MEPFSVDTITLSMRHHETGLPLTANVYSIPGVNNDQPMSMGQLVMAICLARATELESRLIELMQEMDQTSTDLERLTEIEKKVIAGTQLTSEEIDFLEEVLGMSFMRSNSEIQSGFRSWASRQYGTYVLYFGLWPQEAKDMYINLNNTNYQLTESDIDYLKNVAGINLKALPSDLVTQIESKMDSMNSFSQEKMIELQSQTNKRDQSYDMVANVLKSLNTVLIGTANNL